MPAGRARRAHARACAARSARHDVFCWVDDFLRAAFETGLGAFPPPGDAGAPLPENQLPV